MVYIPEVSVFPCHPMGEYTCELVKRDLISRRPFGVVDPNITEPALRFTFRAIDVEKTKPGASVWLMYDTTSGQNAIEFSLKTGIKFGSPRASFTQLLNTLLERKLTVDEVVKIDIDKLIGVKVKLLVDAKTAETGNNYNTITGIKRITKISLEDVTLTEDEIKQTIDSEEYTPFANE